jgi:hypothetical protein
VADISRADAQVTVAALVAILERAASGGRALSHAENILFIACEIRAAAAMRSLSTLLARDPEDSLRSAALVFAAIGATQTAATLRRAAARVDALSTSGQLRRFLRELGQRLCASAEPVDLLIARFASTLVPGPAAPTPRLH